MSSEPKVRFVLTSQTRLLFTNWMNIGHSPDEFFVDIATIQPYLDAFPIDARLILTPAHAKRVLCALSEQVRKYEAAFGPIKDHGTPSGEVIFEGKN